MSVEHTDLLRLLVNTGTELARHTVLELLDEVEQLRETRATLNRSVETLVNAVCAATGDDPADEDYSGMMLRLGQLGERAKDAATSSIQPGDLVENIERPDLDYRRVIGVGEEWIFLDFQLPELEAGELPTPFPRTNYRKVQS